MTTTLYRFYDNDGQLLYVGIAGNPARRFEQHAHEKKWWTDVRRVTVNHFDTREEAAAAEREAIRQEGPLHNVMHRTVPVTATGEIPEVKARLRKDGYGLKIRCPFCGLEHWHGWGFGCRVAHCHPRRPGDQYVLIPANERVAAVTARARAREKGIWGE